MIRNFFFFFSSILTRSMSWRYQVLIAALFSPCLGSPLTVVSLPKAGYRSVGSRLLHLSSSPFGFGDVVAWFSDTVKSVADGNELRPPDTSVRIKLIFSSEKNYSASLISASMLVKLYLNQEFLYVVDVVKLKNKIHFKSFLWI